jgi:hypothetical protein
LWAERGRGARCTVHAEMHHSQVDQYATCTYANNTAALLLWRILARLWLHFCVLHWPNEDGVWWCFPLPKFMHIA